MLIFLAVIITVFIIFVVISIAGICNLQLPHNNKTQVTILISFLLIISYRLAKKFENYL